MSVSFPPEAYPIDFDVEGSSPLLRAAFALLHMAEKVYKTHGWVDKIYALFLPQDVAKEYDVPFPENSPEDALGIVLLPPLAHNMAPDAAFMASDAAFKATADQFEAVGTAIVQEGFMVNVEDLDEEETRALRQQLTADPSTAQTTPHVYRTISVELDSGGVYRVFFAEMHDEERSLEWYQLPPITDEELEARRAAKSVPPEQRN